ncbi:MAG: hypothetical protein ABR598_00290 [Candidatus Dormibacteria bacterium]
MAPSITPAYRVRPLDLGELLDEAFRIYRANFALMFGVALVATAPALVTSIGSGSGGAFGSFQRQYAAALGGGQVAAPDTSLIWLVGVGIVLGIVTFPISSGAPIFAACAVTLGLPATVGSILRESLRNYWRLWAIGIIYVLLELTSFAVISIPFVILVLVRWAFRYQVLYLEHAGVGGSLTRSSALVKGSWWRVFGILLLVVIVIPLVLTLVVDVMTGLLALAAPAGLVRNGVEGLLSSITQALVLPFKAVATTLLYLDMRVRKESLDLQLMAGEAGIAAEHSSPSNLPPPSA